MPDPPSQFEVDAETLAGIPMYPHPDTTPDAVRGRPEDYRHISMTVDRTGSMLYGAGMSHATTIKTLSGIYIDPWDAKPEQIKVSDIAWSLAHINRFIGHSRYPCSVAAHSLWVSMTLDERDQPDDVCLAGLFHDAAEAYLGDVAAPIKYRPEMQPYRDAEDRVMRVIAEVVGFPYPEPPIVKVVDSEAFLVEKVAYRDATGPDRSGATPIDVYEAFLHQYATLGGHP
jgi:hypothetical protein